MNRSTDLPPQKELFGRLHDGFVEGIHLRNDTTVRLSLREVGGQAYATDLIGVSAFLCNDFRQGNIILRISATTGAPPDVRILAFLFDPPHPSVAEPFRKRYEEGIARVVEEIEAGKATLVSITPSYGCDLAALCERVEIERA